jgi:carbohydrate kinase (thermoresistant glucokinase family)
LWKTTVGLRLAEHLNYEFIDGDDFHPIENIDKMKSGQALNDDDRKNWLESIHSYISKSNNSIVIACSALKEKYRKTLVGKSEKIFHWIFLLGDFETIKKRMLSRTGHFMPDSFTPVTI